MTAEITAMNSPAVPADIRSGKGARPSGALIVAAAAVAFSTAGLFTRLISADVWTMLFWRGVFGGLLIAAFIVWRERVVTCAAVTAIGWAGLLTAGCSTVATVCFITALRETTVADVTIIYATSPFIAAGIAWLLASCRYSPQRLAEASSARQYSWTSLPSIGDPVSGPASWLREAND